MTNAVVAQGEYSHEQLALIKATVAKGATDDEFKLFLYRCKHMGLDPLKPGQIHFVKYNNSPGTIIVGIEGFRLRAAQTGKHTGTKRGILKDSAGKCIGAFCEVYRKDWKECAREEVSLSEYDTKKGNWTRMPETMIKKVAEAAALRMAFPDELGGVYAKEEMDQAENSPLREVKTESLVPDVFNDEPLSEFVCKVGKKYSGKKLAEIDPFDLDKFIKATKQWFADEKRTPSADWNEFFDKAEAYLCSLETQDPELDPNEPMPA